MSVATFDLAEAISTGFDNMAINTVPNYVSSLRDRTAAVKVSFTWFGARKAITGAAKENIASGFDADSDSISASKKLFGNHKAIKNLTAIKSKIRQFWLDRTLPFPEDGVRLLRKDDLAQFRYEIEVMQRELADAVDYLDANMWEIKQLAREKLGDLYHESDYPDSFQGKFAVELAFPNVQVPDYLAQIDPEAFEAEKARVAAQFERAVREAEEEFTQQFEKLVSHMCERLECGDDGKPKTFHHTTIDNLKDFFERFKSLNIGSNQKLDDLVSEAQAVVSGIEPKMIRNSDALRESLRIKLSSVADKLDTMMINRPRRRILRDETPETTGDAPSDPENNRDTQSAA